MKALEQSDDVYKWGSTPLLSKGLNMMTVLKAKESFSHLQGALLLEAKMLLSIVVVYILTLSKHTLLKLQILGGEPFHTGEGHMFRQEFEGNNVAVLF